MITGRMPQAPTGFRMIRIGGSFKLRDHNGTGQRPLRSENPQAKTMGQDPGRCNYRDKGGTGMPETDPGRRQEAMNYDTLLAAFHQYEGRLQPRYEAFLAEHGGPDQTVPLLSEIPDYAAFFGIPEEVLQREAEAVRKSFERLPADTVMVRKGDGLYPERLSALPGMPLFLYVRGNAALLQRARAVSLIGSRGASERALREAERLSGVLGAAGYVIVSGLARGIDAAAHTGALEQSFDTIAVIGTPIHQAYPEENRALQDEISRRGLVASPFSPAAQTQRWFFPARNKVMSGLTLASVIVEAGDGSGALLQADAALKQGREVLIPARQADDPSLHWPAEYVRRGAKVFEDDAGLCRMLEDSSLLKEGLPVQQTLPGCF